MTQSNPFQTVAAIKKTLKHDQALLALDVGTKTLGVAVSDATKMIATPLQTIMRKGVKKDIVALKELISDRTVGAILIGLPLDSFGEEGRIAKLARGFGEALTEDWGLPVFFWDETLTSAQAEAVLIEADLSRKKRKKVIDRAAAAQILQSCLDSF